MSADPRKSTVIVVSRQRDQPGASRGLATLAREVLAGAGQTGDVVVHLISARRSAEMNAQFLQHEGPTDVITFDFGSTANHLQGEVFICVAEAERQASEFNTTWREELERYVVHGLLHLQGYDDRDPTSRRRMKREENRLVRAWAAGKAAREGRKA